MELKRNAIKAKGRSSYLKRPFRYLFKPIGLKYQPCCIDCFIMKIQFFIFFSFSLFLAKAQSSITLRTLDVCDSLIYNPYVGYMEPLKLVKKWKSVNGNIDSILWSTSLQPDLTLIRDFRMGVIDSTLFINKLIRNYTDTSMLKCEESDTLVLILAYKKESDLILNILQRYNSFLSTDYKMIYSMGLVEQSKNQKLATLKIKTLSIPYRQCFENKIHQNSISLALIPFKGAFTYNDDDLNKNYLIVSKNKSRVLYIQSAKILIFQEKILPYFEKANIKIRVLEDGVLHQNSITYRKRQHYTYKIGDTINFKRGNVVLDSISKNGNTVFLRENVQVKTRQSILPESFIDEIRSAIGTNSQYAILDFWGTWCTPCIKALPRLKKLNESLNSNINLLSVLFDKKKNIKTAENIFQTHQVKWQQLYNNMYDTSKKVITNYMNISSFPSYALINLDTGEILFQESGESGLSKIEAHLKKLKLSK